MSSEESDEKLPILKKSSDFYENSGILVNIINNLSLSD
jgi:hypothetical protein